MKVEKYSRGIPLASQNSNDKIRQFILGHIDRISPKQRERMERMQSAFTYMLDGGLRTDRDVAKMLMQRYGIGESQAYIDISSAREIFGDARKSTKESERYVASENAKKQFEYAMGKYKETGQKYWIEFAIDQQKIHLKVNALEKDDPDLPDPSKIQPPIQVLQLNIDFITSRYADVIDEKAKKKINQLLAQIKKLVEKNRINDYLDNTVEVPTIEVKENDQP